MPAKAASAAAAGTKGGSAAKAATRAPALLSPEATAAALGDAALAAAADSAGLPLAGGADVDRLHAILQAAYGQMSSSSDEEEPDV